MGMMQAIRCKLGHHEWGPLMGDIEHSHHKCEQCGKVKPLKARPPRGYSGPHGNEHGFHDGGGGQ